MLAPLVLLAAYAGTLELSDSSEARVRSTTGQPAGVPALGFDVTTQPQIRARVRDRRWELTLSYSPLLTLPDFEQGLNPQILQTAILGVGWRSRLVRIAIAADATLGTFNSAYATPTPTGPTMAGVSSTPSLQLTAQPRPVTLLSTHPTASITILADRRTSLMADAGFTRSGGLDAASQLVLPSQRGYIADASVSYVVSRSDQVVTLAHGQDAQFGSLDCSIYTLNLATLGQICAPQGDVLQISERIVHSFERTTQGTLGGGVALALSRLQKDTPFHGVLLPAADVSISHRFGQHGRSNIELGARLTPLFDALTGQLRNQMQIAATVTDALNSVFVLSFTASGLQTFPTTDPLAATMVLEGVELRIIANAQLRFAAGERGAWQSARGVSFLSEMAYFDVTVFAPGVRY